MRRDRRVLLAGVALLLAGWAPTAAANYEVRGTFLYRDRPFGAGGYTGTFSDLPIRFALVEIVFGANTVIASGVTDQNGEFTINVTSSSTGDVRIRCKAAAPAFSTLKVRVLQTSTSAQFAVISPTYPSHNPNTNIDFRAMPVIAMPSDIANVIINPGDAFNIFDNAADAMDFMATLRGSRPTQTLTVYWDINNDICSCYDAASFSIYLVGELADSDGYDDSVILHEIGHYSEHTQSASDNPAIPHGLNGLYDLTLSWSEGYATFFQNMVRSWKGQSRPEIYVDLTGQTGPGHVRISYEVETPSVGVPTAANEVSVNAVLWDIVDSNATPDLSSGTDDDGLALAASEFWQAFTSTGFRTATSISLEDFWDAWFAVGNGFATQMQAILNARSIEYNDDAWEQDDSVAQARSVLAGSAARHYTNYGSGDNDWIVVAVQGGSPYVFETLNLTNDANTRLDLYASNGTSLLASNDDAPSGGLQSRIDYTPAQTSIVYLRCRRATDEHTYGSYDLRVQGTPVPVEVSDVEVAATADGVRLTWRAARSGAFSHFEVERQAPLDWLVLGRAGEPAGVDAPWEYVDRTAESGRTYAYRIVGVEASGERQVFGPFTASVPAPARLVLRVPQPNPFNPTTVLAFEVPRPERVWLRIFDAAGKHVRTLVAAEPLGAGRHQRVWDGRDDRSHGVASGIYIVRLDAGGEHSSQRAVLVR